TQFFVNASASYGIGVVIDKFWHSWRLNDSIFSTHHNIGWAEMLMIELGLALALAVGYSNCHLIMRSDNQGVIGALTAGCSCNVNQNRSLQRITTFMQVHSFYISFIYIESSSNLADPPSRGLIPDSLIRSSHVVTALVG